MQDAANIRPLTALRFFAALWVVLFHFWPKLDVPMTPTFVEKGYLGVELFFILSGFILCHVYRTQVEQGRFRYGSFLWARLARVYPLHIATLVGLGGLALVATQAGLPIDKNILSWPSLPANLLMVHAWGFAPVAGWNHPSWSISAEWFAYLSFPLFAWASLALKNRPFLAVALSGGLLAALYWGFERWAGFPLTQATIQFGFLRIVPCFAFGCALHALWRARSATSAPRSIANVGTALALSVVGAAFGLPDTLIVLALGLLILFLADAAKAGATIGERRFAVYLGEISYSVYMLVVPFKIVFVNGAARALGLADEKLPPLVWIAGIVGLVAAAAVSYHLIEKPARSAMKRLEQKLGAARLSTARA
jgi:peptidoglycan/LPS O-acetylase OafA/YrhL